MYIGLGTTGVIIIIIAKEFIFSATMSMSFDLSVRSSKVTQAHRELD